MGHILGDFFTNESGHPGQNDKAIRFDLLPNYLFTNHKPQTSLLAAKMVVPKAG
jgi:hypothetical protein